MKRSTNLSLSEFRVGLIVGGSFLVGAMVIIAYGKISGIFSRQVDMTALFRNVQGLTQGAPVRLMGIDSGYVSGVEFVRFQGKRYVKVSMRLSRTRFHELSGGTSAEIHTQGLMGIKYVELSPGHSSDGPLNPSLPIMGRESNSLGAVMKSGKDVVRNMKDLSLSLTELANSAKSGQGTVGHLMKDPTLYNNVNQAARDLASLAEKIDHGPGSVSRLLSSDEIYRRLDSTLGSLDVLLAEAKDGQGLAGSLLEDKETARSFKDSLSRLDDILRQIQSGQGTAGRLLYDPVTATRVDKILGRMDSLLKDMKEHPKKYFTVEVHVF